jgi:hypothetical protein
MPAFSNSSAYNEAVGAQREIGAYSFDEMIRNLTRAHDAGAISAELRDQVIAYARQQLEAGMPEPDVIRQIGQQVMPGVEAALAGRVGRLNTISDLNAARTGTAANVTGQIQENLSQQAGDIGRTQEANQGDINDTTTRAMGRVEETAGDILRNTGEAYTGMRAGTNETFGGLRGQNATVGRSLLSSLNDAYTGLRGGNASTFRNLTSRSGDTTRGLIDDSDQTYSDAGDRTDATFAGLRGASGETFGDIRSGNQSTYGNLINTLGNAYRDMRGDTASTYEDLGESSADVFQQSIEDAQKLGPTGDALAARVGRSMAPVVANTASRLRRAGVNPGDPQYLAAMREVEGEQAVAMDDSRAKFAGENVDRVNTLRQAGQTARERLGTGRLNTTLGLGERELAGNERLQTALRRALDDAGLSELANRENLDLTQLDDQQRQAVDAMLQRQGLTLGDLTRQMNLEVTRQANEATLTQNEQDRGRAVVENQFNREADLATGQSDRDTTLGREQGNIYRDTLLRSSGDVNALDLNRSSDSRANSDAALTRTTQLRAQQNQAIALNRAMEQEDWQTAADILHEQNGEELTALDVRNLAYNMGSNWVSSNLGRRDAAMGNIAQMYAQEASRAGEAANQARGFADTSSRNYGQTQATEAGQGNWGTRALVGAGAAGLNFLVPGAGNIVSGAFNPAITPSPGGFTGGYQYGGGQGGGGGGGSPYSFSWQQSPQQQGQQNPWTSVFNSIYNRVSPPANNSANQRNYDYYSTSEIQPDGSLRVRRAG